MSTFVVRFLGDVAEDIRGTARHVSSGEEIPFRSFAELLAFFESMGAVGSAAPAPGGAPGEEEPGR